MQVRLFDVAQQELDEAVEFYNADSLGRGDQFLLEAANAFQRISRLPYAWHPYTENTRRCMTRRFPYGIIYQILESEILVVAIAHMHRKPGYWLDRISNPRDT